ncbi:MAG TPA: hypothetical protein VNN55_03035 [bacterium]|nr:hypothetical protein [bacterium]
MPDQYRFTRVTHGEHTYADGTTVPRLTLEVERLRADGTWETVGYADCHLHRVKRDETDVEDISFGATFRANPKRTIGGT